MNKRNGNAQFYNLRESGAEAYAAKAKEIHAQTTYRTGYYRGYLWRLFLGSVGVVIPEHWSIDYFRRWFFWSGSIAITRFEDVVVPFAYSVTSLNRWKYPLTIQSVDNVQVGTRTVGVDAELLYMSEAYPFDCGIGAGGVHALIDIYAAKLATCDGSIDTNLLVTRTPWMAAVEDGRDADNLKLMFTKIMSGEPAIFFKRRKNKDLMEKREENPFTIVKAKENFIADIVQTEKRLIINEFLTAIGVNNANTEKRERLITDEVVANNNELECAVNLWQDNADICCRKIRNMFPEINISLKFGGGLDDTAGRDADLSAQSTQPKSV